MLTSTALGAKERYIANNFRFKKVEVMVITIKKDTANQDVDKILSKLKPRKLFRAKMFLGKVKWGEDALAYQKKVRNEWD